MASGFLKCHLRTINTSSSSFRLKPTRNISAFSHFPTRKHQHHQLHLFIFAAPPSHKTRILSLSPLQCALSSSSPTPPATKEEAIQQAKTSLSSTLEKPLNNPKLAGKVKKLKQPRLRVEIPVIDDSPSSLTQLALEIFGDMHIKRKASKIKFLLLWPNQSLAQAATKAFESQNSSKHLVDNIDILSISDEDDRILNSADVAVFVAPETSLVAVMKTVSDDLFPKPVVIFNPKWGFEEEGGLGNLSGFLGSFEVVYSFMGLEVRGILSKRKGVVFKCVREGILSGEKWNVLVEEEGGELKVVSTFKARPSIFEVENVLYNLMAINSPITKSAKFLKGLVSNVTGRK